MRVCDIQESKETSNSSASHNNAKRKQCFLRSLAHLDCHGESPGCEEHEKIEDAQCVSPLALDRAGE